MVAIQIGRIAGIPVALDYSWFIIFVLIAWTVGFGYMPQAYPGLGDVAYLTIGVSSSVLLFGSILVHELAHSIVAKRSGLRIRRITLFLLGGVSEMEEEPREPSLEFKMAAAGPLTSLALAAISGLFWELSTVAKASPWIQAPLQYTALFNVIVAGFNLIPAFPMDGGRVLRSLLWMRNRDILHSTRIASTAGKFFAYLMVFGGMFVLFSGDFVTGLWLIIIGWFISSGTESALNQTVIREDLRGLKARDIMTRQVDSVRPDATLEELSNEFFRLKHNGFPVVSNGEMEGCVTAHDLRKVRKESWSATNVKDIMTPRDSLVTTKEDGDAMNALSLMNQNKIGRVFVTNEGGRLAGIITRSDILKAVQVKEGSLRLEGRRGILSRSSLTAEVGMNLVLEQPVESGFDWHAEFADGFQLVSEGVSKSVDGHESKQFTFHANKAGSYAIRLVETKETAGKTKRKKRTIKTVTYAVLVEQAGGARFEG